MVEITCVTENSALRGSPFWGEHGLSFWLETERGCLLFDTGQTVSVLLHNLAVLGKSLQDVDALVLSHAHYDHTGGLPVVLSRRPGLPMYASPDIGRPRFSRQEDRCVDVATMQVQAIDNRKHHDETHAVIPRMVRQGVEVFVTGNIGPNAFRLARSLNRPVGLARKMFNVSFCPFPFYSTIPPARPG